MSSTSVMLAIVTALFAGYMWWLGARSARGAMARSGPGIRIREALVCEHTWVAAQHVAAPIYRRIALALLGTSVVILVLGLFNTSISVVVGLVLSAGVQVFLLGVASTRARKAAAAIRCEHKPVVEAPRAAPPHRSSNRRKGGGGRVTPKKPQKPPSGRRR